MTLGPVDILLVYGGRSTEHEVSCKSARSIYQNLTALGHRVFGLGIAKNGRWYIQNLEEFSGKSPIEPLRVLEDIPVDLLTQKNTKNHGKLLEHPAFKLIQRILGPKTMLAPDFVVFSVIHGTGGEDGTFQGLLDCGEVPYVGPDVLGSALGMDKVIAKKLVEATGIKVVPSLDLKKTQWGAQSLSKIDRFIDQFGLPIFVKPARLGSSVGVAKVKTRDQIKAACERAFEFDDKLLIEKAVKAREIEVGVIGGPEPKVSCPGEVVVHADFYSFEAKYLNKTESRTQVPAQLSPEKTIEVQTLAQRVYNALDLYGMARVDFFLDQDTHELFFNEVNTIPGFTEISLFPVMWRQSGLDSQQLITALLDSAIKRSEMRSNLNRLKD